MRPLVVSLGGEHNAVVTRTLTCEWPDLVAGILKRVPETADKASNGWICAVEFKPAYRHSDNFVSRQLLSLDYDHITPTDADVIREAYGAFAHLTYTTWTHTPGNPRLRVWMPLSRPCGYDEFQAVSRQVAARAGIDLAARESHTPCQYYFRPTRQRGVEIQSWKNLEGPWIDVDAILGEYIDWTDRRFWPHRSEADDVCASGVAESPLLKKGLVGDFCRAFRISDAIDRFQLPYKPGSAEGRYTYTLGSRADGAVVYDDDTKLHSYHDTDPAHGQHNAFDLVRLHLYGWLDAPTAGAPAQGATELPSFQEMRGLAEQQPEYRTQRGLSEGFTDLDRTDTSWLDERPGTGGPEVVPRVPGVEGPPRIRGASTRCCDQENARRLQRRYGDQILCVGGHFYFWQGTHWAMDDASVFRCATHLSLMVKAEAKAEFEKYAALTPEEQKSEAGQRLLDLGNELTEWARRCGMTSTNQACLAQLKNLLAFDPKHLNANPDLLNCRSGTLNLHTGELKPHDPKDYITACAPTFYDAGARAPRFQSFLRDIFRGDAEVVAFAQRWFGYCATGDVREQKLVLHIGPGGNGKGTLMEALGFVLGAEYASPAAPGLLVADGGGARHPAELADLLGKRMATISETEDNVELRESLLKQLTGGDPIKARRMHGDFFAFMPTHKLQIFTNHLPRIRGQDYAIWRRLLKLEYSVKYGDTVEVAAGTADRVKDLDLGKHLRAEGPGILNWLVEGARAWYAGGLQAPASVVEATQQYRLQQDTVGQFVRDRTVQDPAGSVVLTGTADSLFIAYRGWCEEMNGRPLGCPRFVHELLRAAPYASKARTCKGGVDRQIVTGLRLASEAFPPEDS